MIQHLGWGFDNYVVKYPCCTSLSRLGEVSWITLKFLLLPWKNDIQVQNIRNYKIEVWTYLNIHVYKIYKPSEHVFEHVYPYFRLLKIWGVLAQFCDIRDGFLLCKCHKLKNKYGIDKNQSWLYYLGHQGKWWTKTNLGDI